MDARKHADRSHCPIGFSVDIFGDRWTLLVLRELLLMKRTRFRELMAIEERIASNILADRLKRLEAYGIIERLPDPDDGRQLICRPTEAGIALIPTLLEMAAWGLRTAEDEGPGTFLEDFERDREGMIRRYTVQHEET